MNNILIDRNKLELLLEKNKEKIGHNGLQGLDTLFSGITFFVSTMLASYVSIGPISELFIKIVCIVFSGLFCLRGAYMLYTSSRTKYGNSELFSDIVNLNEITHPFSIIVIKDTFEKYPNKYLLYYDSRWDCRLFINYRTNVDSEVANTENIRTRLSNELKIQKDKITIKYKTVKIQRKFSESDKIYKCYEHKIYYVEIPFRADIKKLEFEIDGKHYYWMTIDEMVNDDNIKGKNLDVVDLVMENIP